MFLGDFIFSPFSLSLLSGTFVCVCVCLGGWGSSFQIRLCFACFYFVRLFVCCKCITNNTFFLTDCYERKRTTSCFPSKENDIDWLKDEVKQKWTGVLLSQFPFSAFSLASVCCGGL